MSRRLTAAAAALALAGSPAEAYVRSTSSSGLCLWWSTRQVHYAVNDFTVNAAASVCSSSLPDPAGQAYTKVRDGFATWSAAGGCTDLSLVPERTSSTATGLDCQNLVVFRRGLCSALIPSGDPCRLWDVSGSSTLNCADKHNCWDTDDPSHADARVIALTTVSYVESSGEIVDADMELNAWDGSGPAPPGYYFTCLDPPATSCGLVPGQSNCIATDVQNVVTHEAGHVLGLGHQAGVPTATMYPSAPAGETTKRTLDPDDISGICAIYPAAAPTDVCIGTGQVATRPSSACPQPSGCGCGTAGAEGWFALAALLLWRRRSA